MVGNLAKTNLTWKIDFNCFNADILGSRSHLDSMCSNWKNKGDLAGVLVVLEGCGVVGVAVAQIDRRCNYRQTSGARDT